MAVDRSYVAKNETERRRMDALVRRLDDKALGRSLEAGWTVASVLGHLAFWDQRTVVLVERLRRGGDLPKLDQSNVDWINDAAKPVLLAMPPRQLAELALSIAATADRAVETLSDDLLAKIAAPGSPINVLRAEHRREHLDEVERALAR